VPKGDYNPAMNRLKQILTTWLNSKFLSILFYVALFIGVAQLAVLQLDWVSESAQRHLDSARKELALEVTKSVGAVLKELRFNLLNALANQPESQALFGRYQTIEYNRGWPQYPQDDVRTDLVAQFNEANAQATPSALVKSLDDLKKDNWIGLVEIDDRAYSLKIGQFRLHLFTLDADYLVQRVLLPAFKANLLSYDFVITENGSLLYSTLAEASDSLPDVSVSLSADLQLPPLQELNGELSFREIQSSLPRDSEEDDALRSSPDIFALYEQILKSLSTDQGNDQSQTGIVVSIYAPDRSLQASANRQRLLNSIFSTSVLFLLTITAIVLTLAIRKVRALHNRERDFIATISHELRTPLAVIRSAADNLNAGIVVKPESVNHYGRVIVRQSRRLERMIESTLFYSGLPQQSRVQLTVINSMDFFTELLGPLRQLTGDQGIKLLTELNVERADIAIDTDAVRQIIENLVMNAVIHGTADVGQSLIWLDIHVGQRMLTIVVADNGPGVPRDEQTKIFNAFTRGKRSRQEQLPGSGIGLNLILRTTELLGGGVQLQSPYIGNLGTQQQGALFTVELPLKGG
jgi:signal transduction histidine kinase